MHVYPMEGWLEQNHCMQHCQKLGGRSPSVKTFQEWQSLAEEIQHIKVDPLRLPAQLWLSATEGDKNENLARLDHWPEGIEAEEGVWRDYYTGEQLDNYTKPWYSENKDTVNGDKYNCVLYFPDTVQTASWMEWHCTQLTIGCPCTYKTPPVLHLRGFCPDSDMAVIDFSHYGFTPMHLQDHPAGVTMIGQMAAHLRYNSSYGQWFIKREGSLATANTNASQASYALGKESWTISGDSDKCSRNQESYTIEMKLTACNEDEFTCDDGQCVQMEKRCNQLPNCRDESDEIGCQIILLKPGYNKRVPPIKSAIFHGDSIIPVTVKVSLNLLKVVSLEEEDHSIELQFQINLQWKEKRATYHNLKANMFLNALSTDDINKLWLPLVIYSNTDQLETTRLGMEWEWTTDVWVKREGNFVRSEPTVLDEIEIFEREENSLVMTQSYTHQFQCVYQLERYPFDTQVITSSHIGAIKHIPGLLD